MSKAGKRMIRAAKEAVRFSRLLESMAMEDQTGATTVFVTKKGKVLGSVHGQRFVGQLK